MKRLGSVWLFVVCATILPASHSAIAQGAEPTLLLRQPSISAEHVAFIYAGDLWVADRDGSHPRRLTIHPGIESDPMFSPDGSRIAFTGNYDGNTDVFVVSPAGGSPRRLTFHPGGDEVRGWTPDGERVLFNSRRISHSTRYARLFTITVEGGFPEPLPMPMAERGSYSPNGENIAYTPIREAYGSGSGCSISKRSKWRKSRTRMPATRCPCGSARPCTSFPTAMGR